METGHNDRLRTTFLLTALNDYSDLRDHVKTSFQGNKTYLKCLIFIILA